MLATPMALDLGLSMPTVFAAFSVALAISAMVRPVTGRAIDRHGGRPVLTGTKAVFAAGLVALGLAQGPVSMFAALGTDRPGHGQRPVRSRLRGRSCGCTGTTRAARSPASR